MHKSLPGDLSYMKGRHHLEWHWIQKNGSPDWRRRGDRFYSLVIVLRVITPTSTTLVNLLNGRFMRDPPGVASTDRDANLSKVGVVLAVNPCHDLLEAGQVILEFLDSMMKNVQLGSLLAYHLPHIVGLEKAISG